MSSDAVQTGQTEPCFECVTGPFHTRQIVSAESSTPGDWGQPSPTYYCRKICSGRNNSPRGYCSRKVAHGNSDPHMGGTQTNRCGENDNRAPKPEGGNGHEIDILAGVLTFCGPARCRSYRGDRSRPCRWLAGR